MIGFFGSLFARGEPALSEASARDAAAIAALHAASFRRGWSEQEFERLLIDRHVLAHRAMIGAQLAGFIMSRLAADEAEILSVAVAARQRGRGWRADCSICTCGGSPASARARCSSKSTRTTSRRGGSTHRAGFREVSRRPGYYPQGRGTKPRPRWCCGAICYDGPMDTYPTRSI